MGAPPARLSQLFTGCPVPLLLLPSLDLPLVRGWIHGVLLTPLPHPPPPPLRRGDLPLQHVPPPVVLSPSPRVQGGQPPRRQGLAEVVFHERDPNPAGTDPAPGRYPPHHPPVLVPPQELHPHHPPRRGCPHVVGGLICVGLGGVAELGRLGGVDPVDADRYGVLRQLPGVVPPGRKRVERCVADADGVPVGDLDHPAGYGTPLLEEVGRNVRRGGVPAEERQGGHGRDGAGGSVGGCGRRGGTEEDGGGKVGGGEGVVDREDHLLCPGAAVRVCWLGFLVVVCCCLLKDLLIRAVEVSNMARAYASMGTGVQN